MACLHRSSLSSSFGSRCVRTRAAVRPNICRALRPHARHSSSAFDLCINRDPRSLRSRCRYIAYPRAGEGRLLEVESFNSWDTSLKAMIDHMIGIRKFEIDLSNMSSLNAWQTSDIPIDECDADKQVQFDPEGVDAAVETQFCLLGAAL
eukprot:7389430-Prymnesium_polylepis.2